MWIKKILIIFEKWIKGLTTLKKKFPLSGLQLYKKARNTTNLTKTGFLFFCSSYPTGNSFYYLTTMYVENISVLKKNSLNFFWKLDMQRKCIKLRCVHTNRIMRVIHTFFIPYNLFYSKGKFILIEDLL